LHKREREDTQIARPAVIPELAAIGLSTRKRHGEAAEAAFLAKASSLGFGVAKPWGDSERYDFILDSGAHCWRVQVKSTESRVKSRYRVKAAGWKARYTPDEIDFLVVYIVPENLWYVVPVEACASRQCLQFYPHRGGKGRLEQYREAWCQMACYRHARDPNPILVSRCCQAPSGMDVEQALVPSGRHCAACPLRPEREK
jgi:hypothetical protein